MDVVWKVPARTVQNAVPSKPRSDVLVSLRGTTKDVILFENFKQTAGPFKGTSLHHETLVRSALDGNVVRRLKNRLAVLTDRPPITTNHLLAVTMDEPGVGEMPHESTSGPKRIVRFGHVCVCVCVCSFCVSYDCGTNS